MSEGIRYNNDVCEGLSCFLGLCRIIVHQRMLRGDENISRGEVAGSPVCTHTVSLVELHGQIFMFSEMWGVFMNDVKKGLCMLILDVYKNISEINMKGFNDRFL